MSHKDYEDIGRASTKAVEECAELIVAVQKAERFGWDNYHPRTKEPNRAQIKREAMDVLRTVAALVAELDADAVTP